MAMLNFAFIVLLVGICTKLSTYGYSDLPAVISIGEEKCMCGDYVGTHCAVRTDDYNCVPGAKVTLYGKGCYKHGFYQCPQIRQPAILIGYCPNCHMDTEPGHDYCPSPTSANDLMSAVNDPVKCYCGNWLGLHCGLRVTSDHCKPEKTILYGNCHIYGFYQCSAIHTEATLKGLCPRCQVVKPGRDVCLSPTFV